MCYQKAYLFRSMILDRINIPRRAKVYGLYGATVNTSKTGVQETLSGCVRYTIQGAKYRGRDIP